MKAYFAKVKPGSSEIRRKLVIGALLAAFLAASWMGPYLASFVPGSWLEGRPQNYLFFLPQYLFPFAQTVILSERSPHGFVSLAPYGVGLSLLLWLPLVTVFSHFASRFTYRFIAISAIFFLHGVAIATQCLIVATGLHFELSGP